MPIRFSSAPGVSAVFAGALSLVLLIAYWDAQLILGVAIDCTLITLAVVQPDWLKGFLT